MGWETVGRWWNGQWGRLTRRDVRLSTDGERWRVEARARSDTPWWSRDYIDETSARRMVGELLARGAEQWTDLTDIVHGGPVNPGRRDEPPAR